MTIGIFNTLDIRSTVKVLQLLCGSQEDGAPPKLSEQLQLRNSCTCGGETRKDKELWRHSLTAQYTFTFTQVYFLSDLPLATLLLPQTSPHSLNTSPFSPPPPPPPVKCGHTYVKRPTCPIEQTPKICSSFNPRHPQQQMSFSPNPPPFSLSPPPPLTSVGLYNGPQLLLGW